ncbi:MAG: hypothetical protein R8G33_02420 [Gammaproteobacteria bacterium]|nr:hypothetical protein [Gammaproteobacteria bacterium]
MRALILYLVLFFCLTNTLSASAFLNTDNSFAEEYGKLRILLSNVQDKQSALHYKLEIEQEIQRLNLHHQSGGDRFNALSPQEKKLFIKKFQKNRYHCGDVTQVMVESRRILFDPELAMILRDTLAKIP